MKIWILLILVCRTILSYSDPELEALWASLSNLSDPSLEDYRSIESYLQYGQRPYLANLFRTFSWFVPPEEAKKRIEQRRHFKLLGPNGEMPIFEWHKFNITQETEKRCILIYASYNRSYPQKTRRILEALKECGYSGNVMVRIGGFPNLVEDGLKSCPFFWWKLEFIKEALRMGFTQIVHLDTSLHPLNDLSYLFECLNTKGYFLLHCPWASMPANLTFEDAKLLNISLQEKEKIPWLPGHLIAFNFDDPRGAQLFYEWDKEMRRIDEFFGFAGDEMIMTVLAWRLSYSPIHSIEQCVYMPEYPADPNSLKNGQVLFLYDFHR